MNSKIDFDRLLQKPLESHDFKGFFFDYSVSKSDGPVL